MEKKNKPNRQEVELFLKTGELQKIFLPNWEDHVLKRSEILAFSTIVHDQLYHVKPKGNEIFLPYSEYMGDHTQCWIIAIDIETGQEFFRKNTKTVDMIDWKLSSSKTNPSKDEKQN